MKLIINERQYQLLIEKNDCLASEKIKKIYKNLEDSSGILYAGTEEKDFVAAITSLTTSAEYNELNKYIECKGNQNWIMLKFKTLDEWIISELDYKKTDDLIYLQQIDTHFTQKLKVPKNFSNSKDFENEYYSKLSGFAYEVYLAARNAGWSPLLSIFMVAQTMHETNNYTSCTFICNKNVGGIKYSGIKGTTRGNLIPPNERVGDPCKRKNPWKGSGNNCLENCNDPGNGFCKNTQFYANFETFEKSAEVLVQKYKNTLFGVKEDDIKKTKTIEEFANVLKKRHYYEAPVSEYISGLRVRLNQLGIKV
jgi:hypothetical protein